MFWFYPNMSSLLENVYIYQRRRVIVMLDDEDSLIFCAYLKVTSFARHIFYIRYC